MDCGPWEVSHRECDSQATNTQLGWEGVNVSTGLRHNVARGGLTARVIMSHYAAMLTGRDELVECSTWVTDQKASRFEARWMRCARVRDGRIVGRPSRLEKGKGFGGAGEDGAVSDLSKGVSPVNARRIWESPLAHEKRPARVPKRWMEPFQHALLASLLPCSGEDNRASVMNRRRLARSDALGCLAWGVTASPRPATLPFRIHLR